MGIDNLAAEIKIRVLQQTIDELKKRYSIEQKEITSILVEQVNKFL